MQRIFYFFFLLLWLLLRFSHLRCRSCNNRTSSSTLVEFFQLLNIFSYGTLLFNHWRWLHLRYFNWFLNDHLNLFLNNYLDLFFNYDLYWFFNYDFYWFLNVDFLYNLNRLILGQYSLYFSCFLLNLYLDFS